MTRNETATTTRNQDWLSVVKKKVDGLHYGVVQIVVHNHRVTQIECTEKTRFDAPADPDRQRARDES